MSDFVELDALPAIDAKVITLDVRAKCVYLISVDVTGLDDAEARKRAKRAGEAFGRLLGVNRILVMHERDGRPDARVFELRPETAPL